MDLRKLVPSRIKAYLRDLYRDADVRVALQPLKESGRMSAVQVAAFATAWGNFGFSADKHYMAQLLKVIGDGPVLECGSGATTLLCASAGAPTYSLEQEAGWSKSMRRTLKRTRCSSVTVIDAPLKNYGGWQWYDIDAELPSHFSLVVCDGPYIDKELEEEPSFSAWRYGVLPWLKATQRTFDVLLLDDLNDTRGPALLDRWRKDFGVSVERIASSDGECAIIRPVAR
jgi:hypothetical protein